MNGPHRFLADAKPDTTVEDVPHRDGWRQWSTVLGALIGTSVGAAPIMVFSFGVLLGPVSAAFGWERSTLSGGLFLAVMLNALATPLLGRLIDRHGVRQVTLCAIVLFGLATAAMALMNGSWLLMMFLFGALGFVSAGQSQVPYVTAISLSMERHRGLALGIGMCGLGIGGAIVPPFTEALLANGGWRAAYVGLGLLEIVVAGLAVFTLLRPPPRPPAAAQGTAAASHGAWRTVSRMPHFWAIMVAVLLMSVATNGLFANVVPILTDAGISRNEAVWVASTIGVATIVGKLCSGFLADRFRPQRVAAAAFLLPVITCLVLLSGEAVRFPILVTIPVGIALGAEVALAGTMIGRRFGTANFGEIFGYAALAYSVGVGAGPFVTNALFDRTGSYHAAYLLFLVLLVTAALAVFFLDDRQSTPSDSPARAGDAR